MKPAASEQKKWMQEAEDALARIHTDLTFVAAHVKDKPKTEAEEDDDDIGTLRTLQLVLQYRLDTQDALQQIFGFSHSLWQILGVSKQHSNSVNFERLSFALGSEDLHHVLAMLNRLIDSLLRILKRYYSKPSLAFGKPVLKPVPATQSVLHKKMSHVVDTQKTVNALIDKICLSVTLKPKEPVSSAVFDAYDQLQAPIPRLIEAMGKGMALSGGVYAQCALNCELAPKLENLIQKADYVITHAPQLMSKPPLLFKPTKELSNTEELEARAAEKRLGRFFMYPHP